MSSAKPKSAVKSRPGHKSSRAEAAPRNEELVSPPPVRTPIDRIVLEIRKFLAASILTNSQVAEKVGLGMTDMQVMHMIQLYGPSTPSKLAEWTRLSSGGVTVALDRLEKAGYVRREPNPADRRSLLVTLVPAKLRKMAGMYEGIEQATRDQLATLPPDDLAAVIRFFEAMSKIRE
jgi:DNA-binding MarR family transcriptional regulator